MRLRLFALVLVVVVLLSGCTQDSANIIRETRDECVTGSGKAIKEPREVDPFTVVKMMGPHANLYVTQDGTNTVRVEAQENILDIIDTSVSDGVLTITSDACVNTPFLGRGINIYVTMDDVDGLELYGSGKITGETEITSDELDLGLFGSGKVELDLNVTNLTTTLPGSGTFNLKGTAIEHDTSLIGSGKVNAYGLFTKKTSVLISGSGTAYVYVSEELRPEITGSGRINYKGSPNVINQ
jgi:hypothetical protein